VAPEPDRSVKPSNNSQVRGYQIPGASQLCTQSQAKSKLVMTYWESTPGDPRLSISFITISLFPRITAQVQEVPRQ